MNHTLACRAFLSVFFSSCCLCDENLNKSHEKWSFFQGTGHLNLITVALWFRKAVDAVPSFPVMEIAEAWNLRSGQEDI